MGQYCDFDPNAICGAADATGICRVAEGGCTADCPGVCGCNGKFYCNACGAHQAGTDDSTDRSCLRDGGGNGTACGGRAGNTCGPTFFCDFDPNAMCGAADAQGVCRPRPSICPADCPGVCGCDGRFYCNACTAQSMGTDDVPANAGGGLTCQRDR
jgi:hypothetical protein